MTSLTDRPIPTLRHVPRAEGIPDHPAFRSNMLALRSWDGSGRPWYETRPKIVARLGVVHTNGASREGSTQSAINWGNRAQNNTKPTWAVNDGTATRLVPSDRRSIANSTPSRYERARDVPDVSFWSTSIETRDTGYLDDPHISDFLDDDAELVAMILAYDSLIPGREYELNTVEDDWTAPHGGIATHTAPHPDKYTIVTGKTCPGPKKKATFEQAIVPRARQIRAHWADLIARNFEPGTKPPPKPPRPPGGTMSNVQPIEPTTTIDTRIGLGNIPRLEGGEAVKIGVAFTNGMASLRLTAINPASSDGHIKVSLDGLFNGDVSVCNWSNGQHVSSDPVLMGTVGGHIWLQPTADVDLKVEVFAQEPV